MFALGFLILGIACTNGGPELPGTTGLEVWNFLQEVNYQDDWELWPGKGELYEGGEPHGALFTTYLNPVALDALDNKAGSMPNGAIIIKENYSSDRVFELVTVMYKVQGYNPENSDWFWAKIQSNGTIDAEGQVRGCQTCHSQDKENDFVLTGSLRYSV